jgi:hypothetical protein
MVRPSCDIPRILREARLFPEARVLHQADHSILIVLEVRDARLQLREHPFDEQSPAGHPWHGRTTGPVGSRLTGIPGLEPFSFARNVISSHYVSCLFGSWMNAKLKPLDHFTG